MSIRILETGLRRGAALLVLLFLLLVATASLAQDGAESKSIKNISSDESDNETGRITIRIPLYYFDDPVSVLRGMRPDDIVLLTGTGTQFSSRDELLKARQKLAQERAELNSKRAKLAELRASFRTELGNVEARISTMEAEKLELEAERRREAARLRQATRDKQAAEREKADADKKAAEIEVSLGENESALVAAQKKVSDLSGSSSSTPEKLAAAKGEVKKLEAEKVRLNSRRESFEKASAGAANRIKLAEDTEVEATDAEAGLSDIITDLNNNLKDAKENKGGLVTATDPAKLADELEKQEAATSEQLSKILTQEAELRGKEEKEIETFGEARDNPEVYYAPEKPQSEAKNPFQRVSMYASKGTRAIIARGQREDLQEVVSIIDLYDRPQSQAVLNLYTLEFSSNGTESGAKRANRALEKIEQELYIARRLTERLQTEFRDSLVEVLEEKIKDPKDRYEFYHSGVFNILWGDDRNGAFAKTENELSPEQKLILKDYGRWFLPDPSYATTFMEAMTIFALAKPEYQKCIISSLSKETTLKLPGGKTEKVTELDLAIVECLRDIGVPEKDLKKYFPFGYKVSSSAMKRLAELAGYREGKNENFLTGYPRELVFGLKFQGQRAIRTVLISENFAKIGPKETTAILKRMAGPGYSEPLDGSHQPPRYRRDDEGQLMAREAATNEAIKRLMTSVDDELKRIIYLPTMTRIREQMKDSGVQVGVIQHTSVLARDRLVARVEPSATANLAPKKEAEALKAALQIAQLNTAAQLSPDQLLKQFAELGKERERPPEVYAVTSGNKFQVTPVIDRSGQALRFRFDFLGKTQVREPDNTVEPGFSRIEQHAINTEVQLSNFEIREISRFRSDSRLGVTPRKYGGIPIIKDIPIINEIPLIGWFSRTYGSAPEAQFSIVLAQTSIIPTMGDLYGVLTGDLSKEQY